MSLNIIISILALLCAPVLSYAKVSEKKTWSTLQTINTDESLSSEGGEFKLLKSKGVCKITGTLFGEGSKYRYIFVFWNNKLADARKIEDRYNLPVNINWQSKVVISHQLTLNSDQATQDDLKDTFQHIESLFDSKLTLQCNDSLTPPKYGNYRAVVIYLKKTKDNESELVPVSRLIPVENSPQLAIDTLLGNPTAKEVQQGLSSVNIGVDKFSLTIKNHIAYFKATNKEGYHFSYMDDVYMFDSAIRQTLKQFKDINETKICIADAKNFGMAYLSNEPIEPCDF